MILDEQERKALRHAYESTKDGEERRRLQAVRLYGAGREFGDIEDIVGCSRRSLMRWCARYRVEGIAGLQDKRAGGNRARLTQAQREEVKGRLHQYRPDRLLPPDIRISKGEFWAISDLRMAVKRWYGVTWQSETSYHQLFKDCDFSYQRTENRYRSRPTEEAIAEFEAELEKK